MGDINVRKQINALACGEDAEFDIERYDYILSCRTRLQQSTGKRFSSHTQTVGKVTITRILDKDAIILA